MRTTNFRDGVLHAVAYKLGLDPDQSNFLTNQAIPIGTYIDEWVRRTYDGRDWPEWTATHKFAPNSDHVVTWDATAIDLVIPPSVVGTLVQLGRILKVFIVDPTTTDAPIDTPYTLQDDGVHVGYEHGSYVWIRYIAPPPKFTAIQWSVATTYAKDDPTYSYTTGECYKSKVNNNVGHDPASEGALNPAPPIIDITQGWTPDNPGIAERPEIMVINFTGLDVDVADPPPSGAVYKIYLFDSTPSLIGDSFVTADGVMTINDMIDASVSQLIADLPGTFAVTGDHTAKTVTVQDNSFFTSGATSYRDENNIEHFMTINTQAYIPPVTPVDGAPQVTRITMSTATTFPGATYVLSVTDSGGGVHSVEYASAITDGAAQILQGLIMAIEASSDDYFEGVQLTFDPTLLTLDLSIKDNASVDVVTTVTGSAYWEVVPFPRALADQVICGATADLLKEMGQSDKGAMEEQAVPSETATAEADFDTTPNPAMTGQQRALSRYRI